MGNYVPFASCRVEEIFHIRVEGRTILKLGVIHFNALQAPKISNLPDFLNSALKIRSEIAPRPLFASFLSWSGHTSTHYLDNVLGYFYFYSQ